MRASFRSDEAVTLLAELVPLLLSAEDVYLIYQHMLIMHVATAIMQTNLRTYTQKMTVYPYGPFSSNESTSQAHPVDWKLIKLSASSSNFRIKSTIRNKSEI